MYITYEIGIGGNYSKTSLKLLFHVATNNPALFSLREGTQYYGFNAKCELNKFEDVKFMTNSPAICMHITIKN